VQRNSFAIAVQEKAKFYRERALVLEFGALRRRRERDDDDREKRDDRDGRETPSLTLVKLTLTLLDAVWTSCSAGTSGSFSG
jgi:hypothetical protein